LTSRQFFVIQCILRAARSFFYQDGDGLSSEVLDNDTFVETMELLAYAEQGNTETLIEQFHLGLAQLQPAQPEHDFGTFTATLQVSHKPGEEKYNLSVHLIDAKGLPIMDTNGKADPFVTIELYPRERAAPQSAKSKVIKHTLEPVFEQVFQFVIQGDPSNMVVRLLFQDYDLLSSADYIGETYVQLSSLLEPGKINEPNVFRLPIFRPRLVGKPWRLYRLLQRRDRKDKAAHAFVKFVNELIKHP